MKNTFYVLLILCFLQACASVSSPTGGAKDIEPPKVLSTFPDSAQTNFDGKSVSLTLDEYFTLNNIQKELIISPPVQTPPKIKVYKKKLIIQFQDTLKPNTTYSLNFGEGIKDLNESNTLKNYSLVFSTGSEIDSLSQSGQIIDAQTLEPLKDIKVFLYKTRADSNLIKNQPYYVSRTDENGNFQFAHISDDSFRIYALEDINNNFRMEKDERIAFRSELIYPDSNNLELRLASNTFKDTLKLIRSSVSKKGFMLMLFNQSISQFKESHSIQHNLSNQGKMTRSYTRINKDSFILYLPASTNELDSFNVELKLGTFSFNETIQIQKFSVPKLSVSTLSQFAPNKNVVLHTNNTIIKFNSDFLELYADSIPVENFELQKLTDHQIGIESSFQPAKEYLLVIKKGAFTDLHNQENKTDTLRFKSLSAEETGSVSCNIVLPDNDSNYYVVELLKGDKVIDTQSVNRSGTLSYSYLLPGKYGLRAFHDQNKNQEYDQHDMLGGVQAEKYYNYLKIIEVRPNWEVKDLLFIIE